MPDRRRSRSRETYERRRRRDYRRNRRYSGGNRYRRRERDRDRSPDRNRRRYRPKPQTFDEFSIGKRIVYSLGKTFQSPPVPEVILKAEEVKQKQMELDEQKNVLNKIETMENMNTVFYEAQKEKKEVMITEFAELQKEYQEVLAASIKKHLDSFQDGKLEMFKKMLLLQINQGKTPEEEGKKEDVESRTVLEMITPIFVPEEGQTIGVLEESAFLLGMSAKSLFRPPIVYKGKFQPNTDPKKQRHSSYLKVEPKTVPSKSEPVKDEQ